MVVLYLSYLFQKSTLLVFLVSILLMLGILFLFANPKMDKNAYLLAPEGFHLAYMSQSIFIIGIFNGILVTTMNITLIIQSISFDSLFVANSKRTRLALSKIISAMLVFLLLAMLEYIAVYVYPICMYPSFKLELEGLWVILMFFLSMAFLFSIEAILSTVVNNIFTPMLILFIHLAISLIASSFQDFKNKASLFLPILSTDGSIVQCESLYLLPIWTLLFILLYISIFCIKDLKQ